MHGCSPTDYARARMSRWLRVGLCVLLLVTPILHGFDAHPAKAYQAPMVSANATDARGAVSPSESHLACTGDSPSDRDSGLKTNALSLCCTGGLSCTAMLNVPAVATLQTFQRELPWFIGPTDPSSLSLIPLSPPPRPIV